MSNFYHPAHALLTYFNAVLAFAGFTVFVSSGQDYIYVFNVYPNDMENFN